MPPLDLTDAERLKQVVLDPLAAVLRSEMRNAVRPLIDELAALRTNETRQDQRLEQLEQRLTAVEKFKVRIATVCSGIAVAAGILWRVIQDWVRAHLPKSQ